MLRMAPFEIAFPSSLKEASRLLGDHPQARVCAGGTDLLPNLKHELLDASHVVHLSHIEGLSEITQEADGLRMGALTTLEALHQSDLIRQHAPSLAQAAGAVAGPQLRRMGTLGGNLCLDTRCLYYNQSYFWREALGFCLKRSGDTCHVTQTGKRCVAAASNDTATVLLCLDARVVLVTKDQRREIALQDFYVANGEKNTCLEPTELIESVWVPFAPKNTRRVEGFAKLRHRESIDFPMLSVGARVDLDVSEQIASAVLTLNALAAKPKRLDLGFAVGRKFDEAFINEAADYAFARSIPLSNICDDANWRRDMVRVFVKRALTIS